MIERVAAVSSGPVESSMSRGGAMIDTVLFLDRAPDWVRRLASRIAAGQGILGRTADAVRFRFNADDVPRLPELTDAVVRLVIGPANEAGQGYEWARAVERAVPRATAVAMRGIGADPFQPKVDLTAPVAVYQRSASWHADFDVYLSAQTHVVWESGLPLLGRMCRSDVLREIAHLAGRGVEGALLFHGSDLRPPSRHAASSRWSPFKDPIGPVRALEETTSRNGALAARAGVPVFVSTPDLLQWVEGSLWCPVVVDSSRWRDVAVAPRPGGTPVVAHAPSQKWLKGTDYVEPMLGRLAAEGIIEYRQIVGVPHASMPAFYANADIVLDQFLLGSYGVAACEAMASGRLVMGHVDDVTRAQVREWTGLDLPIHEATIESLEHELRLAAAEPQAFEALRNSGPAFVDAVHDGRRSAAALAPFLGVSS
jgi:hypothetical protein